jgi:hypothetical protein
MEKDKVATQLMVQSHHYHTPLDYEILDKEKRYVRIRPLRIGYGKEDHRLICWKETFGDGKYHTIELKIDDFDFWIKRKYLVRGPFSRSNTKDRWVWKQGFEQMLLNAHTKHNRWKNKWLKSIGKNEEK